MGVFDINNSVQGLDDINKDLAMRDASFKCLKKMYYEGIEDHVKILNDPFGRLILDCTDTGYWSEVKLDYDFDFFSKLHRIDIDCIQLSIYTNKPIHWQSFPIINGRVNNVSLYVSHDLETLISKNGRLRDCFEQMALPKITYNIGHISVFTDYYYDPLVSQGDPACQI